MKLLLSFIILIGWNILFMPISLAFVGGTTPPIKVGSYLSPGLINEDGTGIFNQLNKAIFLEMDQSAQLMISSLNRARKGVSNGELNAYFPELWENLPKDKNNYVVSKPIFYKRIILFTLKDSGLAELSDFKSELLAAVQGFSYGKKIKSDTSLNLVFQENDITNIKLLLNKRVGGVLGGYPGTVNAVKGKDLNSQIYYDLENPVAILESFYVCNNNQEGVKLCNSIDKAIQSLLEKGILELNQESGFSRFNSNRH